MTLKKKNPHRMRNVCDEASSRIGKLIFGNEGLQMEYFLLSWLTLLVFLNLLIYGFFFKKKKQTNKQKKETKLTIKGPRLFHFLGPRETPVRVNL